MFLEADKDGGGFLSLEEFQDLLKVDRVKAWLSMLEMEVNEISGLFVFLDNGDGNISFDEFITGVMRLRGGAKGVDLVTLLYENKKMLDQLKDLQQRVTD